MGVISKDSEQIKLFFHSGNSLGKQTLAYAESSKKSFLGIDLAEQSVTGTQWAEIASGLDIPLSELIDTSHPDFVAAYGTEQVQLDGHDWMKVLEQYPVALAFPIAVMGNEFHAIQSPSDFTRLIENDSAGIQKPYHKN